MRENFIIIDVETAPVENAGDYIDMDGVSAPSNYKDEAKIAAAIEAKRKALVDKAALDRWLARAVVIGFDNGADVNAAFSLKSEEQEKSALEAVWSEVDRIGEPKRQIVGFHVRFDLAILIARSQLLGVKVTHLDLRPYNNDGVLDLAEYLEPFPQAGERCMSRTLESYCKRFGVAQDVADTCTGADVPELIAAGEWGRVVQHCRADLMRTRALAGRLGIIPRWPAEEAA